VDCIAQQGYVRGLPWLKLNRGAELTKTVERSVRSISFRMLGCQSFVISLARSSCCSGDSVVGSAGDFCALPIRPT
jgi:hypothetical protein